MISVTYRRVSNVFSCFILNMFSKLSSSFSQCKQRNHGSDSYKAYWLGIFSFLSPCMCRAPCPAQVLRVSLSLDFVSGGLWLRLDFFYLFTYLLRVDPWQPKNKTPSKPFDGTKLIESGPNHTFFTCQEKTSNKHWPNNDQWSPARSIATTLPDYVFSQLVLSLVRHWHWGRSPLREARSKSPDIVELCFASSLQSEFGIGSFIDMDPKYDTNASITSFAFSSPFLSLPL